MRSLLVRISLLVTLLSGCVEDDASSLLIVSHNRALATVTDTGVSCAPGETAVLRGSINLANDPEEAQYDLNLLMNNFIVDDSDGLLNDPNILKPISLEVEIREFQGGKVSFPGLPNPFTVPLTGAVLDSRMGSAAGAAIWKGVGIPPLYSELLTEYLADELIDQVVLNVYANAESVGDNSVTSDEWVWPVQLRDAPDEAVCTQGDWVCAPGQDGYPFYAGNAACAAP